MCDKNKTMCVPYNRCLYLFCCLWWKDINWDRFKTQVNLTTSPSDTFLSGMDFLSTVLLPFHISVNWQFTFRHWYWFARTNLPKHTKFPSCIYLTREKSTGFRKSSKSFGYYLLSTSMCLHIWNVTLQNIALKHNIIYMLEV